MDYKNIIYKFWDDTCSNFYSYRYRFSVKSLINFLGKHWVSIMMFEIIFILQNPFLTKDTFWIGLSGIFLPYLYEMIIPIILEDHFLTSIMVVAFVLDNLMLFIFMPIKYHIESLKAIMWTLAFSIIYSLCLQCILIPISNKTQKIQNKNRKIVFLIFIYALCLALAFYHNKIIQDIRNVLGVSK